MGTKDLSSLHYQTKNISISGSMIARVVGVAGQGIHIYISKRSRISIVRKTSKEDLFRSGLKVQLGTEQIPTQGLTSE
jgi:hypothetical protein